MMLEMWFRAVTDRVGEVLAMVAAGHNNTAIAAPGLPDRWHRDIRSTRRVRTAGRDGAGRRRCRRRTRGGVLCAGPPDQSRKQAVDVVRDWRGAQAGWDRCGWVAHGRRIGCGSGWASARRSGGRRLDVEVAERVVFALVAQRALEPASKPAATRWVVERVVIDLQPRATTRTPTSSRARGTTTPNDTSA